MEDKVLEIVSKEIAKNNRIAMAIITNVEGSTPREIGTIMAIKKDKSICGTIGGGDLEKEIIDRACECIESGKNERFIFELKEDEGNLHMNCGGHVEVLIKVFKPGSKLLIVGGGHIALELFKLGKMLKFYTTIFEDREEFCNQERFPNADELILGDIEENLIRYDIDENCYIVIITRGHKLDQEALKAVVNTKASYIGMIGSTKKTEIIMDNLLEQDIEKEKLDKVFAPIGLKLGGQSPEEVAFSIMSEILVLKNKGKLAHMKDDMR